MELQQASQAGEERPCPWQQGGRALVDFLEQREEQVELCRQGLEAALQLESSTPSLDEAAAAAEAAVSQALNEIASLGAGYGWDRLPSEPARSTSVALATQLQAVSSALVRPLSQAALQLLQAGNACWAAPHRLVFWLRTLAAAAWLLGAVAEGCSEGGEGRLGLKQGTPVELVSALLQLMLAGIRHIGSVSLQGGCQLQEAVGGAGSQEVVAGCAQQAQHAAAGMARLSHCFPALELAARQLADRRRRPMDPSPRGVILGAALSMLRGLSTLGCIPREDERLLLGLEGAAGEASMLPFVLMDCAWLTAALRTAQEAEEAASSPDSTTKATGEQDVEHSNASPEMLRVPTPLVGRESRSRQLGE